MRHLCFAHTKAFTLLFLLLSTSLSSTSLAQDNNAGDTGVVAKQALQPVAQADLDQLKSTLDSLATQGDLAKTRVGIHVLDLQTGQVLYEHDSSSLYNPASNMKMVTSALALDLFGPAYTFSTTISAPKQKEDIINGNIYLSGTGEGFILYEDVLDWAATIKNKGITSITGDVIVSDGLFKQGAYLPPGFEQKQEDASYRAPIGAVSVNFNATSITIAPGAKAGDKPIITLDPPNDYIDIQSDLTTVSGKTRRLNVQSITSEDGNGTIIKISGKIGTSASAWSTRKRIDSPPLYAGSVFKHALEDLGIKVNGTVKRGDVPKDTHTLVSHGSEPLTELIMAMNKWSNNFMAEQLFRAIGTHEKAGEQRGTWEGSTAVMNTFLSSLGFKEGTDYTLKNGSGLYAGNGLTPKTITTLLAFMYNHTWSVEYISSMAIGGVDGTLAKRFKSSKGMFRGKTGTLNEVSALSGFVTTKGGRKLAVSIILNNPPIYAWRLRSEQDKIAQAIIDFEK